MSVAGIFLPPAHSSLSNFLPPQEQTVSSDNGNISAMFQDGNGVWWSDDRTRYITGSGWVQNKSASSTTTTTPQIPTAARYGSHQQGVSPESHPSACSGAQLGPPEARPLGATMSALFGQCSTTAYQQPRPPNGLFGTDRQTPGMPAVPQTSLDPAFRDAARRDRLIAAFISAHDKSNRGAQ